MSYPLHGAQSCEVWLHRRLIEMWFTSLSNSGVGDIEYWIEVIRTQFGTVSHEPYLPLGRLLLLSWAFNRGAIPIALPPN